MIGEWGENEVVGAKHVPLEAVSPKGLQVGLQHSADQVLSELRPVEVVE
jgi:hypothetical protein